MVSIALISMDVSATIASSPASTSRLLEMGTLVPIVQRATRGTATPAITTTLARLPSTRVLTHLHAWTERPPPPMLAAALALPEPAETAKCAPRSTPVLRPLAFLALLAPTTPRPQRASTAPTARLASWATASSAQSSTRALRTRACAARRIATISRLRASLTSAATVLRVSCATREWDRVWSTTHAQQRFPARTW
jgi:hypothetical protein